MVRSIVCMAVLAGISAIGSVGAQSMPIGARPPVAPASAQPMANRSLSVPGMGVNQTEVGAAGIAQPMATGQTLPAALSAAVEPHRMNRPKGLVPPPSPTIELQSGVNATIGIAYAHTNRLVTPFANPEVKTNSTASITVEDSIVYISTNADDPISLFIHDKDHGDPAISMTLVPEEIPAISTTIHIAGLDGMDASAGGFSQRHRPAAATADQAPTVGGGDPYVITLISAMKDLAHMRVPDGYSLIALRGYSPLMPACVMPGLRLEPAQLLGGSEFQIIVARATNVTYAPVEVHEDGCGDAVRAVAAWPSRVVRPGGSTEVYLVLARPSTEDHSNMRPDVVGGR